MLRPPDLERTIALTAESETTAGVNEMVSISCLSSSLCGEGREDDGI